MLRHGKPIDTLMDCQHVRRWTLVCTTAPSTVASHSFNVACLAMAIRAAMRNTNHFSEQEVCYYAILHDVDESETGDIPTPTKRAMRENGVEPNSLFTTQGLLPEPPPHIKAIIKMADLLENWFFIHEHGSGSRARRSEAGIKQKLLAAIEDAAPDLQAGTREVMDYLVNRKSDDPEERERIARHNQKLREMEQFSRNPGAPYVG